MKSTYCKHCLVKVTFDHGFFRDDDVGCDDGLGGDASCHARPILNGRMQPHEPTCPHSGGFRADTGEWECSGCGFRWESYEAWGEATDNIAAVNAVKSAIAADLADFHG